MSPLIHTASNGWRFTLEPILSAGDSRLSRSPFELTIPSARRRECLQLLATWDARDPWNDVAVHKLTSRFYALIADLTKPRVLVVRGGEAAAELLRGALGANQ